MRNAGARAGSSSHPYDQVNGDSLMAAKSSKKSAAMKRCEGYMKAVRKGKKKTTGKKKK